MVLKIELSSSGRDGGVDLHTVMGEGVEGTLVHVEESRLALWGGRGVYYLRLHATVAHE